MNRGKIFRRSLIIVLSTVFLLSAVVGATAKLYTATGKDYPSEVESQEISKQRALDKAIKKAVKEAGVYLKTYSRTINSELSDDEITAITLNKWKLVGEPKYSREIINHDDDTQIIVWTASVEVNVDDSEIQSWLKRDDKDKSTIISQTREAQKTSEENDKKIEDLREQYNRATSQAEKDSIRKQMNDADREFLAIQKNEEGLRRHYGWNDKGAIELYSEAIELKPDFYEAYRNRAFCYYSSPFLGVTRNYGQAVADYTKAIEFKPDFAEAYKERADCYRDIKDYAKAVADYTKAIELKPDFYEAYRNRAFCYYVHLRDYEKAIEDYTQVIKFDSKHKSSHSDLSNTYKNRADCYLRLKDYEKAIADYTKAIEIRPTDTNPLLANLGAYYSDRALVYKILKRWKQALADYDKYVQYNPEFYVAYSFRAGVHYELKNYNAAFQDYNRAVRFMKKPEWTCYFGRAKTYYKLGDYNKAIEDINSAIQLYPIYKELYQLRGLCYQELGDEAKAQADFAKAKELGYNG